MKKLLEKGVKGLFIYFLRSKKVGTLDLAGPFPADASSMSSANEGPALSALPWPMAGRPWAMVKLTRPALC